MELARWFPHWGVLIYSVLMAGAYKLSCPVAIGDQHGLSGDGFWAVVGTIFGTIIQKSHGSIVDWGVCFWGVVTAWVSRFV